MNIIWPESDILFVLIWKEFSELKKTTFTVDYWFGAANFNMTWIRYFICSNLKRIQWTKEDDVYGGILIWSCQFSRWSTGATQVDATQIIHDTIQLLSFVYLTILSCKTQYLNNSGSGFRLKIDMKPVTTIFSDSQKCVHKSVLPTII